MSEQKGLHGGSGEGASATTAAPLAAPGESRVLGEERDSAGGAGEIRGSQSTLALRQGWAREEMETVWTVVRDTFWLSVTDFQT